jgi:two-component system, NtrC family, sensor kinase
MVSIIKKIPVFWRLLLTGMIIILIMLVTLFYFNLKIVANPTIFGSNPHLKLFTVILIFSILLYFAITWFFARIYFKKPFDTLMSGMERLADKNFDFRLDEDDDSEFSELAFTFNDMASMLSFSLMELKKNQDYLQSILGSSADIIVTVSPNDKIQTINAGAEKILGYERVDLIGRSVKRLFLNPAIKNVVYGKLKSSENVMNYETQFLTKDGVSRDVLFTVSKLRNSEGTDIGTIGIGKDITKEKRLQKELVQSQRFAAIGQVFTGIQHTMKNMLNACKGGAYMVNIGLKKDDKALLGEGWVMVEDGLSRLTDMSLGMLKYVKEWKPKFEKIDLSENLIEIDHVIKKSAEDRGVNFRLDKIENIPLVTCDPRMIHSSVMDIVSNAIDACVWKDYDNGEKAEVVLGAYLNEEDEELVIEVKDNGCGMSEDVKKTIFDPFFSTKSKSGTGLGLAITSRMIRTHNGRFYVESEPNQGTIFRILLPIGNSNTNEERKNG